jgi:hypothetical protein
MIYADYEFELPRSCEDAYQLLSQPKFDVVWQDACIACEVEPNTPVNEGLYYSIEFNFLGRRMSFRCVSNQRIEHRMFGFHSVEGPFSYRGRYDFKPLPSIEQSNAPRCSVHWQFWVETKGFFGIIPDIILKKALESQYQRDVKTLTNLIYEQQSAELLGQLSAKAVSA